jgi:uncharacterized protein
LRQKTIRSGRANLVFEATPDILKKRLENIGSLIMFKQFKNGARIFAGVLCSVVGVIGIILPIVPGMPFLLLAAACFGSLEP